MSPPPHHHSPDTTSTGFLSDTQAQTLNDFAIGVSLFLVTVGFVFAFIPNILAPFGLNDDAGEPIRADRTSNYLLEHSLTTSESDVTLDTACTVAFFENTSASDCPAYTPQTIQSLTGNPDIFGLNVRIIDETGSVVTYDGTRLERGSGLSGNKNRVTSTRMVVLDGEIYRFNVSLW